jgi:hypothetical protein
MASRLTAAVNIFFPPYALLVINKTAAFVSLDATH